jgi:UDP-GlcNAc:undecaprenyl-phosphate/decaprenyl-phosphate GlcNAc-1-phosphate transferase
MLLFLAFVVAVSITAALIPVLERWAPVIGLTDPPGPRKVHSTPVPRVGGLAMGIGLLIPTLLTVHLSLAAYGLVAGNLVLLLFGLWDDRKTLGYRTKFAGQIVAVALCMFIGGIRVGTVTIAGIDLFPGVASTLLTFAFLIGVTNAVNLADGLDGLAGGLVLLCLCAIALFAATSSNSLVTALALIEAGAVLGFLRFNTHPARIFMGDSGSQVLGFSAGALSLMATQSDTSPLSGALPLLLLGLPIVDTLTVMTTRIRAGRSPFTADSNHLHHRLLALGFAHREAVLFIYVAQVALVLLAYFLRFSSDATVLCAFFAFAGLALGFLHWATRSGWRLHDPDKMGYMRRRWLNFMPTAHIPALTLGVMTTCLVIYAAAVVTSSTRVAMDVGLLCLGMLLGLLVLSSWRAEGALKWFERASAYVSVVMLVYLDQTTPDKPPVMTTLSWTLIGITGVGALLRFCFSPTRRFEVTTFDLLVAFIALVMPNLPGSIALPPDLPAGIAKAVILLYVVEMLLTIDLKRLMPRVILIVMLAVIAGRALLDASA